MRYMTQKIVLKNAEWESKQNGLKYCEELERGNLLFFEKIPFSFPQEEIDFLLKQRQGKSKGRKNIAYKPQIDRITNHNAKDFENAKKLHEILRNYSNQVTEFLSDLLAPYEKKWKKDYASFRPFQEKGRDLRLRARNDLLHVDAFPTRPTHGARILRFFTNINPIESRHWITSETFGDLLKKYGGIEGVPLPDENKKSLGKIVREIARKMGFSVSIRSPYDEFMMNFHNFLKENEEFQKDCHKDHWHFPPQSCWIVFTDMVSHAALSGQYALEQTFLVQRQAMLFPDLAPVSILEKLCGKSIVDEGCFVF